MKGSFLLFVSCVLLGVYAETPLSVPGGLSEDDKQSVDSILSILSCIDDPLCLPHQSAETPVSLPEKDIRIRIENYDPSISPEEYLVIFQHQMAQGLVIKGEDDEDEPSDTSMPKPPPPYFTLCEKIHLKLEELEEEHPELKDLKLELLERFNKYSAQFEGSFVSGENVAVKVLDMLLVVVEELKKDFSKQPVVVEEHKVVEIVAEEDEAPFIGSVRGIPGVHYPNYTEVPITSFSCQDKHIPGFYADLETGCQVFHVCYEHRRESFLCPLGTIFNQPILACDYWYSSNCSLAPNFFDKIEEPLTTTEGPVTEEPIEVIEEKITEEKNLKTLVPFIPVTAKVIEYPKKPEGKPVVSVVTGIEAVATKIFGEVIAKKLAEVHGKVAVKTPVEQVSDKVFEEVVTTGLKVASKTRQAIKILPKPVPGFVKVVKPHPVAKTAAIKVKFAAKAAVPFVKSIFAAAKVPVVKTAAAAAVKVPIVKAKVAGAAAAAVKVPIVKAKVAGAAAAAIKVPIVKAKVTGAAAVAFKVPIVKAKVAGAAAAAVKVPIVKAKVAGAAAAAVKVPLVKAKVAGAAAAAVKVPLVKAKVAGAAAAAAKLPIVKAKFATAAIKVPVVKAKVAAASAAAVRIPIVKAKKAAVVFPVTKAKLFKAAAVPFFKVKAAAKPLAKAKLAAAAVPVLKAKKLVQMAPLVKVAALPVVKAKLAASYGLAPLTKKALALGYLKLLKAKKFVVMG